MTTLRIAASVAVPVGAVGSVAFMLVAGSRAPPFLLILFMFWVLSPFVALAVASGVSRRWAAATRATLHGVTLVVALGTLAIYGYVALGPPRAQTAFAFVVVPPASWLLIAVALAIARFVFDRPSSS